MTDKPTGRERWLKEVDIPLDRLRQRFAVNDADRAVWLTGPRKGSRAGRNGVIHSVLDGAQFKLEESRVVFALKHGRWPTNGEGADPGRRNRDDDPRPPKACGFPGVRKTTGGKFKTSIVANGREFAFGPYADAEEAYRIHLAAKAVLDPSEPLRPVKGVRPDSLDRMVAAHRIVRMARRSGDKALEVDALGAFIEPSDVIRAFALAAALAFAAHAEAGTLTCSTWQGVRTCTDASGYVSHESTWNGITTGSDNCGDRWSTSTWQDHETTTVMPGRER